MYEKIKKWYLQGLWTEEMVQNAVKKGVLTQLQGKAVLQQ
jgi:urease accessory protein UreF